MKLRRAVLLFIHFSLVINLALGLNCALVNAQTNTNSFNGSRANSRFSNQPQGPARGYNFIDRRPITDPMNRSQCGFKPMPNVGCEIGDCINGRWKQNCISDEFECGFKPIPNVGCEVGACVDGAWEQVCPNEPPPECGFKPIPIEGCQVGECIRGVWQMDCKGNPDLDCGFKPFPNEGCRIGECKNGSWQQICR